MRRPHEHDEPGGGDHRRMDSSRIDRAWFDERVEPYLDGELPDAERRRFSERLRHDVALRAQVAFAEQISLTLAASGAVKCSDDLAARLESIPRLATTTEAGLSSRVMPLRVIRANERPRAGFLPMSPAARSAAVAASFVALFAFAAVLLTRVPADSELDTNDQAVYTEAEVEQALRDARYALAWVSEAGRHAGTSVIEPVIERNVVGSANRATGVVFGPGAPAADNRNEPSGDFQ